jgi:hypothetical protein
MAARNPYLKPSRLGDVIAAITALGSHAVFRLEAGGWADRISGSPESAQHWEAVFREHPEFFRVGGDGIHFSLVWRRQFPRIYDIELGAEIGADKLGGISRDKLGRRPLSPSEITALIGVAIDLHERALAQEKASKWWIPVATSFLAFVGALIGALIVSARRQMP